MWGKRLFGCTRNFQLITHRNRRIGAALIDKLPLSLHKFKPTQGELSLKGQLGDMKPTLVGSKMCIDEIV